MNLTDLLGELQRTLARTTGKETLRSSGVALSIAVGLLFEVVTVTLFWNVNTHMYVWTDMHKMMLGGKNQVPGQYIHDFI